MEKPADDENTATGADFQLKAFARRVEPMVFWNDLTLPHATLSRLREICTTAREISRISSEWGFGERLSNVNNIMVIFSGPPGSCKTMATDAIATDLKIPLYRIDLSKVVSKYIGETEKNLDRIFDATDGSSSMLFFDEADDLFGIRTDMPDANDRYSNAETGYLLQKMESYSGIVILATNLSQSMDPAYLRRARFVVEFPSPDGECRKKLWKIVWGWLRKVLLRS